jgi:hypothetical protein
MRRWGIDELQSTRTLRTARVLQETLAAGYTAVRDAAGLDAGFKRAIDEGLIAGPRLVVSLCIVSPIGGIGDWVSPSGFSCCVPNDPLLPDGVVHSLADVRPVVRRIVPMLNQHVEDFALLINRGRHRYIGLLAIRTASRRDAIGRSAAAGAAAACGRSKDRISAPSAVPFRRKCPAHAWPRDSQHPGNSA